MINQSAISFDVAVLRDTLEESGLPPRFPQLSEPVQAKLAAAAASLVGFSVSAPSDESFEQALVDFEAPASDSEFAFLFAMVDHLRTGLLQHTEDLEGVLALQPLVDGRLARARALCAQACGVVDEVRVGGVKPS